EYITLKGPTANVYPYIKSSQVVLHFSDIEGASNVILEGMVLGKPIISTDCGDTRYYIENYKNGWIINPFSVDIMTKYIMNLISDPHLYNDISKNNMSFIEQYDISKSIVFFKQAIDIK